MQKERPCVIIQSDVGNINSRGLMKNIKKYEEKIENLNKYIEKLKEN